MMSRSLHSVGDVTDVVVDPYLARHLKQHQREGVSFMYDCVMGMREQNAGETSIPIFFTKCYF